MDTAITTWMRVDYNVVTLTHSGQHSQVLMVVGRISVHSEITAIKDQIL